MFATSTKDAVTSDVKSGASRVGNDIRQTANNVRQDLNQANTQSHLEDVAHQVGERIHGYLDTATNEFNATSRQITSKINQNPVESVIVAGVVGFLFGLLSRR